MPAAVCDLRLGAHFDQPRRHLLPVVLRLLPEQHPLHAVGLHRSLPLRLRLQIRRAVNRHPQVHQNTDALPHPLLPGKQTAADHIGLQPALRPLQPGTFPVIQLFMFRKYNAAFYIYGWIITLYPLVLAWWYFRKHWTCRDDLKLTFSAMLARPSYL